MSITGIQGQLLEVTVVGCTKLKDTEWISRQDPYVCLEYASTKFRTRTCTDGGKNPTFQEKFIFTLIEGLREINVVVWNSNTLSYDDFIGSGKVQLQRVLSQGYDDSSWPLQTKTGKHAGDVKLILHYANAKANKPASNYAPSAPPYAATSNSQVPLYAAPPSAAATNYPPPACAHSYPPPASAYSYPSPASAVPYPPPATTYPASSPYPSYSSAYPPSPYPPPAAYPPPPYPPTSVYPPPPFPPPPANTYYPPGPYPGTYPPPPY